MGVADAFDVERKGIAPARAGAPNRGALPHARAGMQQVLLFEHESAADAVRRRVRVALDRALARKARRDAR